jgi:hypothetical protein
MGVGATHFKSSDVHGAWYLAHTGGKGDIRGIGFDHERLSTRHFSFAFPGNGCIGVKEGKHENVYDADGFQKWLIGRGAKPLGGGFWRLGDGTGIKFDRAGNRLTAFGLADDRSHGRGIQFHLEQNGGMGEWSDFEMPRSDRAGGPARNRSLGGHDRYGGAARAAAPARRPVRQDAPNYATQYSAVMRILKGILEHRNDPQAGFRGLATEFGKLMVSIQREPALLQDGDRKEELRTLRDQLKLLRANFFELGSPEAGQIDKWTKILDDVVGTVT